MADIPDTLIMLERSAEAEREKLHGLDRDEHTAQWARWYEASWAVQQAITEHATTAGENRFEVERAVKKAARHPAPPETAAA